jgi:hypothetical protein
MLIRLDKKCLEEVFIGYKVSISYIRTFSYIIYTNIPKETYSKLKLVARKIILVSYLLILK